MAASAGPVAAVLMKRRDPWALGMALRAVPTISSGKQPHSYGKTPFLMGTSPFLMGKLTIDDHFQ